MTSEKVKVCRHPLYTKDVIMLVLIVDMGISESIFALTLRLYRPYVGYCTPIKGGRGRVASNMG